MLKTYSLQLSYVCVEFVPVSTQKQKDPISQIAEIREGQYSVLMSKLLLL